MENTPRKIVVLNMRDGKYVLSEKPQPTASSSQPTLHPDFIKQLPTAKNTSKNIQPATNIVHRSVSAASSSQPTLHPDFIKQLPTAKNTSKNIQPATNIVHRNVSASISDSIFSASNKPNISKPISSNSPINLETTKSSIDAGLRDLLVSIGQKMDDMTKKITNLDQKLNEIETNHANRVRVVEKNQAIIKTKLDLILDKISPRPGLVTNSSFNWEPIASKEMLDAVDQQLNDQQYKKEFKEYLECQLPTDSSEERLHSAMDIIFAKQFVIEMSWTGIGHPNQKFPLFGYKNILALFKHIGTFHGVTPTPQKIKTFFQNKLKHARQRLNLEGKI
ncbi:uncharacterized protein LOC118515147 isoform X1 [Anopheles stephensi]|uniref:uncharacterized protein LOC118515147 isoform X1 n=1 Tax=Anopheles stephensi TaxID=30069 RepID=UPI001658B20B|nr:uncharacterized protein LOC118515147 isoform X1 [Anopheles stephensi]XP_035917741.1 uncharacterized protein LOC118515147 isoform X1 [Anopheles stephensi]XP_035917742.1 uncharacterized protein LOC118515147 isoform X1 [Anopheles stephensi]XP_035917743.1 uncharacterized protein LOC118515147 isoform X1 [Anopheles stephensi]XP_035917745.1 uncharacterized protein LOC118515147 isoform X1 [Anopheles stephensi]